MVLNDADSVLDVKTIKALNQNRSDEWDAKCRKMWDGRNRGEGYHEAICRILTAAGVDPRERKWDNVMRGECSKNLEGEGIDCDFQSDPALVERGGENVGCSRERDPPDVSGFDGVDYPHKRRRENVVSSYEYVTDDDDVDPQYLAVLGCMKEHGNAYALEDENGGSPLLCVYEGKSSVGEVCESEWKARTGFIPVEKPGRLNHEQEKIASLTGQKSREGFLLTKNVKPLEPYEHADDVQTNKKDNMQSNISLKKRVKEKNAATGEDDPYKKAVTQKSKGHLLPRCSPRLNPVTEGPSMILDITQRGRKDKVLNLAMSNRNFKEKTVVLGYNVPVRRLKNRSREESESDSEEESESDSEARDRHERVLQSRTKTKNNDMMVDRRIKLNKVVRVENTIQTGGKDNIKYFTKRNAENHTDMEILDKSVILRKGNPSSSVHSKRRIERNRPHNEVKIDGRRKVKYTTQNIGDNHTDMEILDGAANLRKENPRSSIPPKTHFERVDRNQPDKEVKVDRLRKLKYSSRNKVEIHSDMEILDGAAKLRKENPISSIPPKKHFERVDCNQPHNGVKVDEQRKKGIREGNVIQAGTKCSNNSTKINQPYKEVKVDGRRKWKKVIAEENVTQTGRKGYKSSTKINQGKHYNDDSSDVEILDSAAIIKEGNHSCFVHMMRHNNDEGGSSASADFREKVLKVIKKPYDQDEYQRLTLAFKPYHKKHCDLQRRMIKYRNKKVKRLGYLRGFFYWVQNVVHDNVFKPWKDKECLAACPGSD